jgi:DNA polymerase-3 subunit alpha
LVKAASNFGMPALALTDRNNLYGAIEFYKACEKEKIKPILGVDADFGIAGIEGHVIFLAENEAGYKNLLSLVSRAHMEHPEGPRIGSDNLRENGSGLIALIPETALVGRGSAALVEEMKSALGENSVFALLGWNGGRQEQLRTMGIAKALGLRLAASDGTYYLKPDDKETRDIVRRIANPGAAADGNDRAFASPATLEERYREFPDAISAMEEIVARATVKLPLGSWIFPEFPLPAGTTAEAELEKLARAGLIRLNLTDAGAEERLSYELGVINGKGFAPYFLAVSDLLSHARESGILTTTRGSAAGSLVSYATGITNINPIEYRLPFERFLNPLRPKAPDIDMDIADNRRDEMVAYAKKKYGPERVAQIGTFGTMMARAAVRDVARAMGYPYGVGDRIAKLIPFGSQGFPMTLEHALEIEEDLKKLYQSDEDAEIIINAARKIEGNARHISVHAAGVVIAPSAVTNFTPIQYDPSGQLIITQYDMYSLADEYGGVGLLKFDFLGLTVLSVLGQAVERVKERTGEAVDIAHVPLNDEKVFAMLARGETEGVFQLSGSGMTRYLKDLKPSSIHDINAMVALYRPGPMESIPAYIARKNDPRLVTYLDPRMKDILDRSYGIITYQDDVLLTAVTLGGYSWLDADNLRKAMGKKIPAVMAAEKDKLTKGFIEHGKLTPGKAEAIWKLIEPFAAYGFGKAHAASYGMVAYQTAYMKAHYPEDYMATVMTSDSGDTDKIAVHVAECARMGIKVLPPDVNESFETFTVSKLGVIRFGLASIKNFGDGAAASIIAERTAKGPFATMGDFLARVPGSVLNRRALESLIKSGVFDAFATRGALLANIEKLVEFSKGAQEKSDHQHSLFGVSTAKPADVRLDPAPPAPMAEVLSWEKELLGIYVSGHPLDRFSELLGKFRGSIALAKTEEREGYPLQIAGIVETVKTILTKKGDRMGFVTIADRDASIEAVAFPETFKKNHEALAENVCVLIAGKLSKRNGQPTIIIEKMKRLEGAV